MKNAMIKKRQNAQRRAKRTRVKLHGTAARPRLSVNRSLKFISAQLIDDDAGRTLVSATDRKEKRTGTRTDMAAVVGKKLGEGAVAAGIKKAVVDRGPYKFHGRVKALVEAAQAAGLTYKNE